MLVLACSVFLCAGVWMLRAPMMAALTRDTRIQQQLQQVLPVVVAAIICEWPAGQYSADSVSSSAVDACINSSAHG
jgi:hypothetical protein